MNKIIRIIFISILFLSVAQVPAQQQVSIAEVTAAAQHEVAVKSYTRTSSASRTPVVHKINSIKDRCNNASMYEVVFADGQAVSGALTHSNNKFLKILT